MKPITAALICSLAANGVAAYLLLSGPRSESKTGRSRITTVSRPVGLPAAGLPATGSAEAGSAERQPFPSATSFSPTGARGTAGPLVDWLNFSSRVEKATPNTIRDFFAEAQSAPTSAERLQRLNAVFRQWGALSPAEAFVALVDFPLSERKDLEIDILRGWAMKDPIAAWEWMDKNPPPITSTTVNPVNAGRYNAIADTLLAAGRPDLLRAALNRTTDDAERVVLSTRIADYLARNDAPAAVEWLLELPAGAARNQAAAKMTRTLAEESPDLALGLATKLPGNAGRNQAIAAVFAQWAETGDPRQAEAWLSSQKPAAAIDTALVAFLPITATRDPAVAERLLNHFSVPATRQKAIDQAATKIALLDPVKAIEWTLQQSPESPERAKKLTPFFKAWYKANPNDAITRAPTLPLSADEREALAAALPAPPAPKK